MKHLLRKEGFTIIEVSLVLAIAGIILTMAFIALPALQRQSRDAQRKTDASKFITALKEYQRNNRGALPAKGTENEGVYKADDWSTFYADYLGSSISNPSGGSYSFVVLGDKNGSWPVGYTYEKVKAGTSSSNVDWYVYLSATCENGEPKKSNNARNIAMLVKLETGDVYCINN